MTVTDEHVDIKRDTVRPRRIRRRAVAVVAVLVVIVAALVVWFVAGRGTATPPYTSDPSATSRLTLCAHGAAVTKGSTSTMADTVVGSGPETGTATLFAYQPRQGLTPTTWSGLQLTASAPVSDPASLTLTKADTTLAQFIGAYPALWDGWVQLRLYVTTPGQPVADTYSAVDLHVDGDHWTAYHPGSARCA